MSGKSYPEDTGTPIQKIREAELRTVEPLFLPGTTVLEIGGWSGFQASLLAERGCHVVSVDVVLNSTVGLFHDVVCYDGANLPFPNAVFDVVYSSNTLEHVRNLPFLLNEMLRVLKPSGFMVHVVPSSSWRIWTILAHYLWLPKFLLFGRRACVGFSPDAVSNALKRSPWHWMKRVLFPGPHGEASSSVVEIFQYAGSAWHRLLERNTGLDVSRVSNTLFYTGYLLFPALSLASRKRLARILGGSCHIFILHRQSSDLQQPALPQDVLGELGS